MNTIVSIYGGISIFIAFVYFVLFLFEGEYETPWEPLALSILWPLTLLKAIYKQIINIWKL